MSTNENKSGLEEYVSKTFKEFQTDRKDLEVKWQGNIDAFNKELQTRWKKNEGGKSEKDSWRSKRFIGITKQKCEAAHSIIVDTVLQGGKIPYFLDQSDLDQQKIESESTEVKDAEDQNKEIMTANINEQLKECKAKEQFSENVLSAAIYGETYGKTSVKSVKKSGYGYIADEDGIQKWSKVSESYDYPKYEALSIWDVFRDLESDDLQTGRAVIHRQMMSAFDLRKMSNQKFMLKRRILDVISSLSGDADEEDTGSLSPAKREIKNRRKKITLIEYWGRVPAKLAKKFEMEIDAEDKKKNGDFSVVMNDIHEVDEEDGKEVEVMIMMANHTIIRYVKTDAGERPFYHSVWDKPIDGVAGCGVSDNIIEIQELINGSVRAFEDNKKLTGNLILALKRRYLLDQKQEIEPGTTIDLSEECDDARQAIQQVQFTDVGESLISMINMAQQFADDESSVPRVQQGAGGSGRETAFELSQRLEKSGKYLSKIIGYFDEGIIEPVISYFLDFNMMDEKSEGKGNYKVVANGFTSFQNRVTKLAGIRQAIEMIQSDERLNNKVKIEEIYKEFTELLDIDTDRWFMNEEEDEARKEQEAQILQLQQRQAELEVQKLESEIALEKARAETLIAETKMKAEELKVKMLEEANRANQVA